MRLKKCFYLFNLPCFSTFNLGGWQEGDGGDDRNLWPHQSPFLPHLSKHRDVSAKPVALGDDFYLFIHLPPFLLVSF